MRVKVARWGNSLAVRIPRQVTEKAGLKVGDEIEIDGVDALAHLRPAVKRYTLEDLFAQARSGGTLRPPELVDWGGDRGSEGLPDDDWSDIAPNDEEMGIANASRGRPSS